MNDNTSSRDTYSTLSIPSGLKMTYNSMTSCTINYYGNNNCGWEATSKGILTNVTAAPTVSAGTYHTCVMIDMYLGHY